MAFSNSVLVALALLSASSCVLSFQVSPAISERRVDIRTFAHSNDGQQQPAECSSSSSSSGTSAAADRRSFLTSAGILLSASLASTEAASAAIDVTGLREQSSKGGGDVITSQLKSYDGSGSARIKEIAAASTAPPPAAGGGAYAARTPSPDADTGSAAVYAYRSGGVPSLRPMGLGGLLQRYEGNVAPPPGSTLNKIPLSFDFPSDWLQLDKLGGGITYVDQRNGDKLYILRAPLPEGSTLASVPKSFFAESVFDSRGDVIKFGVIESARTAKAQMSESCDTGKLCVPRRRALLKYDTVTGNGVQTVERRALVDAYEVGGYAYMLMTSSNAVKFEAKGKERETVEAIVDSFRLGL